MVCGKGWSVHFAKISFIYLRSIFKPSIHFIEVIQYLFVEDMDYFTKVVNENSFSQK